MSFRIVSLFPSEIELSSPSQQAVLRDLEGPANNEKSLTATRGLHLQARIHFHLQEEMTGPTATCPARNGSQDC